LGSLLDDELDSTAVGIADEERCSVPPPHGTLGDLQAVARQKPCPGWVRTTERFVDPGSGKTVDVFYEPSSGERQYVSQNPETANKPR
jgi:hypothetical protein